MIDQRRQCSAFRQRAVSRDPEGEFWRIEGKKNDFSELWPLSDKVFNVLGGCNPPSQSSTSIPVRTKLLGIVHSKPTGPTWINAFWITCNDFEIDATSKLKAMVVRAHVEMSRAERHVDIQALSNVMNTFAERWRDNGEMVESEHALPYQRAVPNSIKRPDGREL